MRWPDLHAVTCVLGVLGADRGGQDNPAGEVSRVVGSARTAVAYLSACDVPRAAAILAHNIVRVHPLVDGNKRTAWLLARTMLRLNELNPFQPAEVPFSPAEVVDAMVGLVVSGRGEGPGSSALAIDKLAELFRRHLPQKLESPAEALESKLLPES